MEHQQCAAPTPSNPPAAVACAPLPEDPDATLTLLGGWSREALLALAAGLDRLLAAPVPDVIAARPHVPGITLRHETVQCGKPGCTRCPHGPYWYAYWREGNRTRKRYIGKRLPDDLDQVALLRKPA